MKARNASLRRTRYISVTCMVRENFIDRSTDLHAGLANRSRSDPIQPRAEHHRQDKTALRCPGPPRGGIGCAKSESRDNGNAAGKGRRRGRERREGKTGIWSGPRVIIARAGRVFPSLLRPSAPRQRSTMTNWSCGWAPHPTRLPRSTAWRYEDRPPLTVSFPVPSLLPQPAARGNFWVSKNRKESGNEPCPRSPLPSAALFIGLCAMRAMPAKMARK